jgi:TolA-binding protein
MLNSYSTVAILMMAFALSLSGCLRTRAQIRDGASDSTEGTEVYGAPAITPVQGSQGSSQYDVDEIKQEMTRLQGRIEDLERKQKEWEEEKANSSKKSEEAQNLSERLGKLEQSLGDLKESLSKNTLGSSFDKAKSQFEAGNFSESSEMLTSYLSSPSPKKVEEATFLRAESYFKLKEYKKAIVDYSKFPEKFSRSSRMPAALYKIGLSFEALGMREDAKGFFQELADKYPKSSEAKKIKNKLKQS